MKQLLRVSSCLFGLVAGLVCVDAQNSPAMMHPAMPGIGHDFLLGGSPSAVASDPTAKVAAPDPQGPNGQLPQGQVPQSQLPMAGMPWQLPTDPSGDSQRAQQPMPEAPSEATMRAQLPQPNLPDNLPEITSGTPVRTLYWVGGNGNWTDINHWSTTSGGAANSTTAPSDNDDVNFDALSDGNPSGITPFTITLNDVTSSNTLNFRCFTGATVTFEVLSSMLNVSGDFILSPTATVNWNLHTLNLRSVLPGNNLNTFANTIYFLNFLGAGGEWVMQGNVLATTTYLSNGTLNMNGRTLTTTTFSANFTSTRAINFGVGARLDRKSVV